ncbi:MAG: leucyl aminopeptidase [bacterium]
MPRTPRAKTTLGGGRPSTPLPLSDVRFGAPLDPTAAMLVVALEETTALDREAAALDVQLGGCIASILEAGSFSGELLESASVFANTSGGARRVLVVGLGKRDALTAERVRRAAGLAVRRARAVGATRFEIAVPAFAQIARGDLDAGALTQAVLEGALLGAYSYLSLKTEPAPKSKQSKPIESISLALPRAASKSKADAGHARARAIAAGVYLARDLACLPPNRLTPAGLADAALELASRGKIRVRVEDAAWMATQKMDAILAVAAGSVLPPRFVVLEYASGRPRARRLAIIGKGLTFDSGGISIKPAQRMEEMKYDMCGAAAVLGVFRALAESGAPVDVVGVIPATENMPSGSAVRPGDVIGSHSGKTIEVLNTDAEGRLVLADALSYVEQTFKPEAMIDLATLTGAVGTALGVHAAGLFTEDDALAARIEGAGRETNERAWRLPLWEEYDEHVRSDIADVKNIANGNVGAGAIIGAAFLKRFVGKTPWAHLDIANVAWGDKEGHYSPRGPSGYGVRLLLRVIDSWAKKNG